MRAAYDLHAEDDDLGQPGALVREVMTQAARLVANVAGHASHPDVTDAMKPRIAAYWTSVDGEVGAAVAQGLGQPVPATAGASSSYTRP